MMQRGVSIACGLALTLVLGMAGGCQQQITAESVRKDPSPELQSLSMTEGQRLNRKARTENTNARQIHDDMERLLLQDRPSRLSPYQVP